MINYRPISEHRGYSRDQHPLKPSAPSVGPQPRRCQTEVEWCGEMIAGRPPGQRSTQTGSVH